MLRDQVIALNLELEDKTKIEGLLRRKIEAEKASLPRMEDEVKAHFQATMQDDSKIQDEKRQEVTIKSQKLMEEKERLLQLCKDLVDAIKETERNIQTEVRAMHREHDEALERERKAFRSTYDDRLQKFLSAKAGEFKAATDKAMAPEFARLQAAHDIEISELESSFASEERRLKDLAKQRCQALLEQEKQDAKNELALATKALQDRVVREIEQLMRDHKRSIQQLHEEGEREVEKQRHRLSEKATKDRAQYYDEIKAAQEQNQRHLLELKKAHMARMQEIEEEHQQEIQAVRAQRRRQEEAMERQLKQGSGLRRSADEEEESEDELLPRSPLRMQPPGSSHITLSPRYPPSPARSERPNGSTGRAVSVSTNSEEGRDLPVELREKLEAARGELVANRDKSLQADIRQMETEMIRLEREWRNKAEAEKISILATTKKEEEQLQRRQRQLTDEIADYAVERERVYQKLQEVASREEALNKEAERMKREVAVYKDGLAVQQQRTREKGEQHRLALRELQLQYAPLIRDLREQCEEIQQETKEMEDKWEAEMRESERAHASELARLDASVKEQVAARDQEMAVLREVVDEEQVRRAKLSALLNQYASGASGAEIAGAMTTKSSKSRTSMRSGRDAEDGPDGHSQYTSRSMATATVTSQRYPSSSSRLSKK